MKYEIGKFYWVWIALDPDAENDWENELMPARFSGYSEEGNELWNFIDAEPSEWPVRLAYNITNKEV